MMKIAITLFSTLIFIQTLSAQAPSWTVNSSEFENSMSVVAVAEVESVELTSTGSMIGAFVGSELRGVAYTSFVNADNRFVAHILIWSNIGGGETITFQIYDDATDEIVESVNSLSFQNDASQGNTSEPFVIRDNNAPIAIALTVSSILENQESGTLIGALSTEDVDIGDTHSYEIVAGDGDDDNALFEIDVNNLRSAAPLNHETQESLSIRIRTTDDKSGVFESSIEITVSDENDPPTDIALSETTINENNAEDDIVGTLSTSDEDDGESFVYTLVAGEGDTDNESFNISGNKLTAVATFDFEEQSTFDIRIETKDGSDETYSKQFQIAINDINDPPTEILISKSSIAENQGTGVLVGELSSTDDDIADEHLYGLVNSGSNDNEDFSIIGNKLYTKALFDFELRQAYVINVETDDQNGGVINKAINLTITDSNDPPTEVSMSDQLVAENQVIGTVVGDLETTDQDITDRFTYRLVSGPGDDDNDAFDIVGDEVRTESALNFELRTNYSIRISSRDLGGGSVESVFIINVEDQNDVPTDIALDNATVPENLSLGIVVGGLSTIDEDQTDDHFFAFVEGDGDDDNTSFSISNGRLLTKATFDFETQAIHSVRIESTDGTGDTFQKAFSVSILDTNDDPTLLQLAPTSINENLAVGSKVGAFSIMDQDESQPVFTLIPGTNDNNLFKIEGTDLTTTETFDFESDDQYFIDVLGNDGDGGLVVNRFEVNVDDANDAPSAILISDSTVPENQPLGSIVGQMTTADQDVDDNHIYSLVTGSADNENFRIVGNELLTDAVFNYEVKSSYEVQIRTTDEAGESFEMSFVVVISDANDIPTNIQLSSAIVNEEEALGTILGLLTIEDEDLDDVFNIRLVGGEGGEDSDDFAIDGDKLVTKAIFDAETRTNYSVRINVTDSDGGSISKIFALSILPVNEPPQLESQEFSVAERSSVGTMVGTISGSDVDGDPLTYAIVTDGLPFSIEPISGVLSVAVDELDYESTDLYELEVSVTDVEGFSAKALAVISVEDVIEQAQGLPANDFVSPNNDGFNDFFKIQNVELYSGFTLRIFNNAGVEVYLSRNYNNTWNGVDKNGNKLAKGAYYFTFVSATDPISFRGSITLVR